MGSRLPLLARLEMSGGKCSIFLPERRFPADEVVALASARSIGTEVSFATRP